MAQAGGPPEGNTAAVLPNRPVAIRRIIPLGTAVMDEELMWRTGFPAGSVARPSAAQKG